MMRLTLNVLRCPDAAVPESRQSSGSDIAIGRGLECDWVLQDPDRVLSKRHCVLEFRGGYWQVRDTSTNGTFLNGSADPVGRDMVAPLSDGDRLRFGNYEIEVRVAADPAAPWTGAVGTSAPLPGTSPAQAGHWGTAAIGSSSGPGRPAADPFAAPFAPPPGSVGGTLLPGGPGGLPADWDPLADMAPMPDHSPAASDAFVPPKPMALPPASAIPPNWDPFGDTPPGAAPPPASPASAFGADGSLPADWDPLADLAAPGLAGVPPMTPTSQEAALPPTGSVRHLATSTTGALPAAGGINPAAAPVPGSGRPHPLPSADNPSFADPAESEFGPPAGPVSAQGEQGLPLQPANGPVPEAMPVPPEALGDPFAEEGVPSRSIPLAVEPPAAPWADPPPMAAPSPIQAAAHAAPPLPVAASHTAPPSLPVVSHAAPRSPPAASHATAPPPHASAHAPLAAPTGDAAAALAALLRGAAIAPGALSASARENPLAVFEQTGAALRAAVAGLRALLIARADVKREFRIEQTMLRAVGNNPLKFAATDDMAVGALISGQGTRAVAETVNDLTAHEVATLAATQAAARALLNRLAPEVVEEADGGGGGLFGGREKRLWDAYRKLHTKVTEQFEDDFDSVFGKEFARAYEQAVASKTGMGDDAHR